MVAEFIIANNYHQFLMNAIAGYRSKDSKGNLLDWNGRPASEDANPMYDFVNNLSEESRAELIKNYKESGKESHR